MLILTISLSQLPSYPLPPIKQFLFLIISFTNINGKFTIHVCKKFVKGKFNIHRSKISEQKNIHQICSFVSRTRPLKEDNIEHPMNKTLVWN